MNRAATIALAPVSLVYGTVVNIRLCILSKWDFQNGDRRRSGD